MNIPLVPVSRSFLNSSLLKYGASTLLSLKAVTKKLLRLSDVVSVPLDAIDVRKSMARPLLMSIVSSLEHEVMAIAATEIKNK